MGTKARRTPPRTRVRLLLRCQAAVGRLPPPLRIPWIGLWLGLLDRRDLHALDGACYDGWAEYHGSEHNRRGLWPWEERALDAHFPTEGRFLVVAAGGGREALALVARGYAIHGCECHPDLLRVAQKRLAEVAPGARLLPSPRDGLAAPTRDYDGAFLGWGAHSLVAGRGRRVDLLTSLGRHLRPGAPVLLSFLAHIGRAPGLRAIAPVANAVRRFRRRAPVERGDTLAPNFVHVFDRPGILAEVDAAGFDVVDDRVDDDAYPHLVARRRT
ncbi:MAG: class I SAM-dependent methyltransferase [Acidobacteriota bacterium]